ncbi:MAG: lipopolysaccharide transport system permease protein [Solirubrobacteraceae bacterium]|jgi:lipopolysaccharide transport system permease protein|nr:lipopolysaccharide transport system permease protein [Solirubrobacteraceae bacterium]
MASPIAPETTTPAPERAERAPGPVRRRLHILLALARSDLRIRYGRGGWQVVNWIVNPFALVGIYLLLRVVLGRAGNDAALSIACAVVPFQIVLLAFESSMGAVGLREPILLNRRFDRMLIPPAAVMTESLAFGASFLMFPLAMAYYGVGPTLALLWLPVVVAATLTLAVGIAWPAALLGLWLPTTRVFAAQGLRVLFFAAPGVVALAEVPEGVRRWIVYNPLTGLFESFRHVFLYGDSPKLWELAYPALLGIALTLVFVPLYRREQRHFAKLVRG